MPSEAVVKSVSKKLKYYFQVKRLEDGFDLSGPDCPRLDHPPTKARPTLQYDGLHDRPLKHYFSPSEVRTLLTQFKVPEEGEGDEYAVKKRVKKYIHKYDFKGVPGSGDTGHGVIWKTGPAPFIRVRGGEVLARAVDDEAAKPKTDKPSALPDTYYMRRKNGSRNTRHETMGYGVPLKKAKSKPKSSYPILRSTPNCLMTRGEANRLVNMATKLIVATDTFELKSEDDRKQEKQPYIYGKQNDSLPHLDKTGTKTKRVSEDERSYASSDHDGYVTITGKPADDRKVPPWLKKEMRSSKVKGKDSAQRPHSAAAPKVNSQRPPSGSRPKSAVVSRPRSSKKPKPHKPAEVSTLPPDVQPAAWDLEVCSTCADEAQAENPPPKPRHTSAQTSGELLRDYDPMDKVIWDGEMCRYRVHVYTGNRLGASTKAEVKLVLCGDKGRTEEIWLHGSKKHRIQFQKGQEDVFDLEQFYVGKMRKIAIGHDRTELGYGWFLDKVVVKDMVRLIRYEIPCGRWLSSKEGDGLTVREFSVALDTMFREEDSDREEEEQVHMETRKAPAAPPITYTKPESSYEETASHTSLDMNRSRQGSTTGSGSRRSRGRTPSGHSSSTYSADTSPYSTDTESTTSRSSRSDGASTPRPPQQPRVHVPAQKRHDDFFDQSVSEKDYTSVLESLADRDRDFPTMQNRTSEESSGRSKEMTLKPVPNAQHVKFSQEKPEKTPKIYEDSDSETARLSIGDQFTRSEPEHQFIDGFKAGLEAAKKSERTRKSPSGSDSDSDRAVLVGISVHEAAKSGDLERIKQLVNHNPAQKTLKDERDWSPLHLSARHGQVEVVQWLSVNLTDLDVLTPTGYTAIHIAAMNGHTDCIKVLSAMGAQLDCRNLDDQTPLHLAAMSGFLDTVKWLVANDADLQARDSSDHTPLERARMYEHGQVVQYLQTCQREARDPTSKYSLTHTTTTTASSTRKSRSMSSGTSRTSTSSSSTDTDTPRVHAHAHSAATDGGRPKTSRGARGGRAPVEHGGHSSDKETEHDAELMNKSNAQQPSYDGPSFLDSIRAEYEQA